MIKALMHRSIRQFEKRYTYDAGYMHEIAEVSPSALMRLMRLSGMTDYKGSETPLWGGAALAGTLHGDCGPCAQLVVDRLLEAQISEEVIQACLNQNWNSAGSMSLGFRFAKAILNNEPGLDQLRAQINQEFGKEALMAAAYATVSYPVYPLLKRALGHAQLCTSVTVGQANEISLNSV